MIEWMLILMLHTDRAASHGHTLVVERHPTEQVCNDAAQVHLTKDNRDTYTCVPVAALPEE